MRTLSQRFTWPDACAGEAAPPANDWLLWQLADSAFPTGGFAHSGGLEAAWQHGELRGNAELVSFVEASLRQFGHSSLPFMLAAHNAPDQFPEIDRLCESFTTNHVANRASRLQGQALLASAERIFDAPELQRLRRSGEHQPPYCHLAPLFGVVTRSLALDSAGAGRMFFFLHGRGLLASAVRLGVAGPIEAQRLQLQLGPMSATILSDCRSLTLEDIAQTAPLLELWQGTQDRLYSRLFQS